MFFSVAISGQSRFSLLTESCKGHASKRSPESVSAETRRSPPVALHALENVGINLLEFEKRDALANAEVQARASHGLSSQSIPLGFRANRRA